MLRIFLALWLALTPALSWAGSMSLLGVGKAAGGGGGPPSLTFITASNLVDGGANKTLTAVGIGTASATRIIFAVVVGSLIGGGVLPTSLTFTPNAGSPVTATLVINQTVSTDPWGAIYQAVVPTGTTMDVTLAWASNPFSNFQMSLWSSDTSTMSSTTATGTAKNNLASGNAVVTATLAASAGGFIIVGAVSEQSASNSTTWSGGETYTKRFDTSINGVQSSFADASNITGNASDTATATFAQSTAAVGIIAASWR